MYDCESRSPKIKNLKADGQGQPVTGQNYGALAVQVMDANSIHVTGNKGGKPEFDQTRSASQDGKTLTISSTNYPADGSAPTNPKASGRAFPRDLRAQMEPPVRSVFRAFRR